MLPILIIAGNAGTGKDTMANYIAGRYGGVAVAQADPLKLMARDFFGFTDRQLFGPSEARNEIDPRLSGDGVSIVSYFRQRFESTAIKWVDRLFPSRHAEAMGELRSWFNGMLAHAPQLSPRLVLQTLGSEWGRTLDPEVWAQYARTVAMKLLSGNNTYTKESGIVSEPGRKPYNLALITDGRFANEILGTLAIGGGAVLVERPGNQLRAQAEASGVAGHVSESELDRIPGHFYTAKIVNGSSIIDLYRDADQMIEAFFGIKPLNMFEPSK
jgi:hypothetical protein